MKITVNEKEQFIESSSSLLKLIKKFPIYSKNSAVSINNNIIPKETWEKHILKKGDKVIFFHIIAGG
ncbi:sulfur carrier protein ThiS [Buchnera aphidicola (Mindarus keteleerifoliae)]|uniref:sulfur carrier protein ThiS n=1 Tax=Buchnera aphidicola TaxID=9 RepID=UPI0031B6D5B4